MYISDPRPNTRIAVADILRGIAVAGIVLLHTLEHSGFYSFPEQAAYNTMVWDVTFFFLSNKMYAIFALLFGLSFFIQNDNQAQKGVDFRARFAWRMFLLFVIGVVNCAIYDGDILMIYAIGGILMIPFIRATNRVLAIVAVILFLQPIELFYLVRAVFNSEVMPLDLSAWKHYAAINPVMENGGFWETCVVSLQHGFFANVYSALENGRLTQTLFLFLLGILLGRRRLLYNEENNLRFWQRILIVSAFGFMLLYPLSYLLPESMENQTIRHSVNVILNMWRNMSMVGIIVSGIVLLYYSTNFSKLLSKIAPYGRMSLTNYIGASVVGGFLFFNWGWGECRYLSHLWSICLGMGIVLIQYIFSCWWLKGHKRGPMEEFWRWATWIRK